jgi:geranylgeranyl reductase family protein
MKTNVAIIGAGPAGSSAAIALSKKGIPNIIIDKRRTIGLPVQCAEFVSSNITSYVDLGSMLSAVNQKIKYIYINAGNKTYKHSGSGYILNRDIFDLNLSEKAVQLGSKLFAGSRVYKIDRQKNCIEVLDVLEKIVYEIYYDYLIIAAGPNNIFKSNNSHRESYIYALQIKTELLRKLDSVFCYFRNYIPYGYGWVFPKGNHANVGIGVEKPVSDVNLSACLKKFADELRSEGLIGSEVIEKTSGLVPVSGLNDLTADNIAFCGDAGGLTHPVTGAGILNAVISGNLAGDYTADSVVASKNFLNDYKEEVESIFKKPFLTASKKRYRLYPLMNDEYGISKNIKFLWPSFEEYYV